jgi:hypothetical protein
MFFSFAFAVVAAVGCAPALPEMAHGEMAAPSAPPAPLLALVPTIPATTCVATNPVAVLDGEALLDPREENRWSLQCLPTAKTASDDAIRGALAVRPEDVLAVTHGVWVTGDGYGRRVARWMVRIDLEDPRLPVTDRRRSYFVDGAKPEPSVDAYRPEEVAVDGAVRRGSNPYPVGYFYAVDATTWRRGTSPLAEPLPAASAQLFPQEAVETTRFRVVRFAGGCLDSAVPCDERPLINACAAAKETGCVTPLLAGIEARAAAVRAEKQPLLLFHDTRGFRWILSEKELVDALAVGGAAPVDTVEAVRALEVARGERRAGTERIEPGRGGFRIFGDAPVEPGVCSGAFVDRQGVRTPACLPPEPCHAPTPAQKAELRHLGHAVPAAVCEEEDGCYALPLSTAQNPYGKCPCSERVCRSALALAAGVTVERPPGEMPPKPFLERFCPLCPSGPNR